MSSEQLDIYLRNSYWGKKKEGNIVYLAFPLISLFFFDHPGPKKILLQDFISWSPEIEPVPLPVVAQTSREFPHLIFLLLSS